MSGTFDLFNVMCKQRHRAALLTVKVKEAQETGDGQQCTNTYCADSETIEEPRGRHEGPLTDVDMISHPVQRHC